MQVLRREELRVKILEILKEKGALTPQQIEAALSDYIVGDSAFRYALRKLFDTGQVQKHPNVTNADTRTRLYFTNNQQ